MRWNAGIWSALIVFGFVFGSSGDADRDRAAQGADGPQANAAGAGTGTGAGTAAVSATIPVPVLPPASSVQRVYVPLDELEAILERDRTGVFLPREEFRKLYEQAASESAGALRLPRGLVASSAEYRARIDGDQLLVTAEVTLTQFARGWQSVRLALGDVAVESARLNDVPARLGRMSTLLAAARRESLEAADPRAFVAALLPGTTESNDDLVLLSETPGRQVLTLEMSTRLAALGSDKTAGLRLLPGVPGTLSVTLPPRRQLLVDGLEVARPAAVDQPAEYRIPVGGRSQATLRITEQGTRQATDALVFATTAYGLQVAPGEATWQAATTLQVFGRPLDRLVCRVPKTLEVADATSSGLEAWSLEDDPDSADHTRLVLDWRQPFDGPRKIVFRGVTTMAPGERWTVPDLQLKDVTSHVGRVVVRQPPGVRLRLIESRGTRRIAGDGSPADEAVAAPAGAGKRPAVAEASRGALRFDAWREDFVLSFATETKDREVQAGISTVLDVHRKGWDLAAEATLQTAFAPLFDVQVALPAEWLVGELRIDGRPTTWRTVSDEAGENVLRVDLPVPLSPGKSLAVSVRAHRDPEDWPPTENGADFALPRIRLPQADVLEGTYAVRGADDLRVVPEEIAGLDPARLAQDGAYLGWRYQDTVYSGTLRIAAKTARVAAETLGIHRLDPQTLVSHLETVLDVSGGSLRKVDLVLPDTTSPDVRFRVLEGSVRIVEQFSVKRRDGTRVFTLLFDQPLQGRLRAAVDTETDRGTRKEFQLPLVRVPEADRDSGYVAVEAGSEQRLSIKALGSDDLPLADVDPVDVPAPHDYRPKERIVAAYRHLAPGARVFVTEERFDRLAVPTALCLSDETTSVFASTGTFQHRTELQVVAVGVQGVHVALPEGARLWSTVLNGTPIEVRKSSAGYFVPLPPIDPPETPRSLVLVYQTQHAPLRTFGGIAQHPVRLAVDAGGGERQPLSVLDHRWNVRYPAQTRVVDSRGRYEPQRTLDRTSWLGRLEQAFRAESWSAIGGRTAVLGAVGAIVGLLFLLHRRWGWWGPSGLVAAGVLAFCVLGYAMLPAVQQSREAAQRAVARHAAPKSAPVGAIDGRSRSEEMHFAPQTGADADRDMSPSEPLVGAIPSPTVQPPPMAPADMPMPAREMPKSEAPRTDEAKPDAPRFEAPDDGRQRNLDERLAKDDALRPGEGLAAGEKAGRRVDRSTSGKEGKAALLSVAVDFVEPADMRQMAFRYLGTGETREGEAPLELRLAYEDQRTATSLRWFLVALTAGVFWLLRHRSWSVKGLALALAWCVPLGLIGVAPVAWHVVLDGLFAGGWAGLVVTCAAALIAGRKRSATAGPNTTAAHGTIGTMGAVAILLGAGLASHVGNESAWAQPNPGPRPRPAAPQFAPPQVAQPPAPRFAPNSAPNAAPQTVSGPAANPSATSAPRGEEDVEADADRLAPTTIVVPYDPAGDPLKGDRVYLPRSQFLELWNLAHPEDRKAGPAPTDGLVVGAAYRATPSWKAAGKGPAADAEQDAATKSADAARIEVQARFVLHVFSEGQVSLPLPLGTVSIREARLDDAPAPLVTDPRAAHEPYRVAVSGRGTHVVDLTFDVPARRTGAAGQCVLPLRPVATGRLTFALPEPGLVVRTNGSADAFRLQRDGGQESLVLPVDRAGDVTVAWQPKQSAALVEATVHAEAEWLVRIADAGTSLGAGYRFQVRQGTLETLVFRLPEPLGLESVQGPDVGGWELAGAKDERRLKVFLRRPVADATQVVFALHVPGRVAEKEAKFDLPAFGPEGITRETGVVALLVDPAFSVREGETQGLMQVEPGSVRTGLVARPAERAPDLAYRFSGRPIALRANVVRRAPESRTTVAHALRIEHRKIRFDSRFVFALAGAPRSRLAVAVPEDFLPLEVAAAGLADWYRTTDDEGRTLVVLELSEPRTGEVEVVLEGTQARDPELPGLEIAPPAAVEVDRTTGHLAVFLEEGYGAKIDETVGWRAVGPDRLPAELRAVGGRAARFAFEAVPAELSALALTLERTVPRLSADAIETIDVQDTGVSYVFALQWQIAQAAADTFVVRTPGFLARRLEFDVPGLREVRETELPDGSIRWTVQLQEPVAKRFGFVATAALPPAEDGRVTAALPVFEQAGANGAAGAEEGAGAEPRPLETQRRYVVVTNRSRGQLVPVDPGALETIPAEDLPLSNRSALGNLERSTTIGRVLSTERRPAWTIRRAAEVKGAPATIALADLVTVVDRDGSWRTQATWTLRNRSRQFLAVRLPEDSRLLSVFVGDRPARPVELRRDKHVLRLVALPKTSEADLSVAVKLVCAGRLAEGPLPRVARLGRKQIDLPAPEIPELADDAEYGIPVARTQWTVHLPEDLDAELLSDPDRCNLVPIETRQSELIYEMARLQEASELLNVLSSSRSLKQKGLAWSNVQQLEGRLKYGSEGYREAPSKPGQEDLVRQFNDLNAAVQQEIRRNKVQDAIGRPENDRTAVAGEGQSAANEQDARSVDALRQGQAKKLLADNYFQPQSQEAAQDKQVFRLKEAPETKPSSKTDSGDASAAVGNKRSQLRMQSEQKVQELQSQIDRQGQGQGQGPGQAAQDPFAPQVSPGRQPSQSPSKTPRRGPQGAGGQPGGGFRDGEELERGARLGGANGVFGGAPANGPLDFGGAAWRQVGGLSLAIELPTGGRTHVFTKVGGGPRLGLGLRPRSTLEAAFGFAWTVVWLGCAAFVALALTRGTGPGGLRTRIAVALLAVGTIAFLILPSPLGWAGLAAFAAGAVLAALSARRTGAAPA